MLAVSNRFPVEALEEIYAGIALACKHYKVDLVGGDTTSSTSGLVMSITAIGMEDSENIVKRSGAKPNDLLVVTGDLGGAYLGLQILEREHAVYLANPDMQPEMEGYDYILERQLKPEARTDIKKTLNELGVKPTSMIDISDGLSSEILELGNTCCSDCSFPAWHGCSCSICFCKTKGKVQGNNFLPLHNSYAYAISGYSCSELSCFR